MSKTYFSGSLNPLSRRLMKIGAAAVLGMVLIQSTAFAQPVNVRPAEIQGALEIKALGTLESRDGENKVDFLKRVGRVLDGYTATTQLEACGVIIERSNKEEATEGKWVVPMVTQMSHIACAAVITLPHDGIMTGETIHSHPAFENGRYVANQADVKFFQGLHGKRIRRGQRMTLNQKGEPTFSSTDFAGGPGWLVEQGQLLFQNGRNNVVNHGSIEVHYDVRMTDTMPIPSLPGVPSGQIQMVDIQNMGGQAQRIHDMLAVNQPPKP